MVQTLYSKWEEEGAAWVQMQPSARFGDTDIIPSRSVRLSPEQLSLIDRHFDEVRVWSCLFHFWQCPGYLCFELLSFSSWCSAYAGIAMPVVFSLNRRRRSATCWLQMWVLQGLCPVGVQDLDGKGPRWLCHWALGAKSACVPGPAQAMRNLLPPHQCLFQALAGASHGLQLCL